MTRGSFTLRHYRTRWNHHRNNAKARGISFRLTFEQWLDIWQRSGHIDESGRKSHQFCMARKGDKGAYEVGNVMIITQLENNSVEKPSIAKANSRRVWSESSKAKSRRSQKRIGNRPPSWEGKHHSAATRKKISRALREFRRKVAA